MEETRNDGGAAEDRGMQGDRLERRRQSNREAQKKYKAKQKHQVRR
jgi:hypothetical protein